MGRLNLNQEELDEEGRTLADPRSSLTRSLKYLRNVRYQIFSSRCLGAGQKS